MKIVFKKPYIYLLIGIFILYFVVNLLISGFYETIPLIITYVNAVNWTKLIFSLILTIIIGILVALNAAYVYIAYSKRKKCVAGAAGASIGTIGGLIAGFCPLCVTGLFPIIFGLFGITFSLASLPFQGIELQIVVVILLLISLKILTKNS